MNKIFVEVTLSRTRKPLSYPCYIRGKGKFYKSVEIKSVEDFIAHAFAIDRGIVLEDSATQNG
jgi:hypothetical protein|tara:strand:+ start:42 stop:230 length:189 start_codon:yes stop_codon:yes gene_type:complete